MNIHFIASRTSLEKDMDNLRVLANIVKRNGHVIVDEWFEDAYDLLVKNKSVRSDWTAVVNKRLDAIAKADIVIAEASYENFAVGYQVAKAVYQKKPVLLLHHQSADKNAFATGVIDNWVRHQEYTMEDAEEVIKAFVEENDIKSKDMRFNFFIDRKIYNYLRWSAQRTGKTKAEILRELVEKEIDHENGQ